MKGDETNFPINVDSPFVNFLQKIILWSIKVLALLMAFVIVWSVIDVFFALYKKSREAPWMLIEIDSLLETFGAFLVVLIAIEIFLNIVLYLRKDMGHIKLVMATALMAIARKVIILDYDHLAEWHLVGMGCLILALGVAYWFVAKASTLNRPSPVISPDTDLHKGPNHH